MLSNLAFKFNLRSYNEETPMYFERPTQLLDLFAQLEVGLGGLCLPRRHPYFRPSILDLKCSL